MIMFTQKYKAESISDQSSFPFKRFPIPNLDVAITEANHNVFVIHLNIKDSFSVAAAFELCKTGIISQPAFVQTMFKFAPDSFQSPNVVLYKVVPSIYEKVSL